VASARHVRQSAVVELSNAANGIVVADAVRFERIE
jgi:hypothetical protein